jgi:hypothetical protein
MTEHRPSRARQPADPPTAVDLAERDRYAALAAGSAEAVRAGARAWEKALTAFITLITAGVILKGRDSTADVAGDWRAGIVALAGGGLLLAVFALWQAVAAEAGTHPQATTLRDIRADHGTLDAYQVYLAVQAARRLRWGIRSAAAAMTLLIAGIIATWLAPAAAARPPALVTITHGGAVTCGTLLPGRPGQARLSIPGRTRQATIPASAITAINPASACP